MSSPPCCGRRSGGACPPGGSSRWLPGWCAEREEEIQAFVPQEYWSLEAELERVRPNLGRFKAQFYGREKKMELRSRGGGRRRWSGRCQTAPFSVTRVKRQDKLRNPAPPFTTSTLQQEASRKLNMTPAPHHVHRPAAL